MNILITVFYIIPSYNMPNNENLWNHKNNPSENANKNNFQVNGHNEDLAADTADNLLWKELTPEVDGFTAQVALSLIEHGRAEEVARDFDKYTNLSDKIVFKMLDALDTYMHPEYCNNISQDILKRYIMRDEDYSHISNNLDIPVEYVEYLNYAPDSWKQQFIKFDAWRQKKLSEQIEFFSDTISIIVDLKLDNVFKKAKIFIDNQDYQVTLWEAEKTDEIEIINGNTYMTIEWAKNIIPQELHIKGSMLKAIWDIMPLVEEFKYHRDLPQLKMVNDLLDIKVKWFLMKWDKKVNHKDWKSWLMTMWYSIKDGKATKNPIVFGAWDAKLTGMWRCGTMYPMKPWFMAPVRKMTKPIEILE